MFAYYLWNVLTLGYFVALKHAIRKGILAASLEQPVSGRIAQAAIDRVKVPA